MAASYRHSWASQLQAGDELWYQRCDGGYVPARVVDLSVQNNACRVEYHVHVRGGRQRRRALVKLHELMRTQQEQLSMAEDSSEDEMDADCALSPDAKYDLTDPVALAKFLQEADIRLVPAKYLGHLILCKQPLQRRQELESAKFTTYEGKVESALVRHEEVQSWAVGDREAIICSISHAWETREHPDPCRYQLQHVVNWTSLCEAAFYADVWVFYDYASLFQFERLSAREESSFRAAMENMHVLYAHECSLTLRIQSLTPDDVWERMKLNKAKLVPVYDLNQKQVVGKPLQDLVENRNLYVDRGWCRAEIEWSSLRSVNGQHQRIDDCDADAVRSDGLNGRVPTTPEEFADQMKTAAFTHRSDAGSVIHLQSKIFHEKVTACEALVLRDLSASQIGALARGLPNYKSLKSIKVTKFECGEAEAKAFGEALAQSQVERLELWEASDLSSGRFMAKALAEALKINTSVFEISLWSNKIGVPGAEALAEALKINTSVRHINLEDNPIGNRGAEALAEALKINTSVREINLENNCIGDTGAEALAEALKINTSVREISLWSNNVAYMSNKIGDAGAEALAEALKINTSVCKIDFQGHEIGDRGAEASRRIRQFLQRNREAAMGLEKECAQEDSKNTHPVSGRRPFEAQVRIKALAEALKTNTSVRFIGLGNNWIGDRGAEALAEALKINTSVREISLFSNKIGDAGAEAIAEALKINTRVQGINLLGNHIGDQGAEAIAEALKTNTSVHDIMLEENGIGDQGAEALAEALKINASVQQIALAENKIADRGAEALAEALKINTSVRRIDLEENRIGDRGAEALAEAQKINRSVSICR